MTEKKQKSVLRFNDGTEIVATKDGGKYWICGDTRFRKSNPRIVSVERVGDKKKVRAEYDRKD